MNDTHKCIIVCLLILCVLVSILIYNVFNTKDANTSLNSKYPFHWKYPPDIQTKDQVKLPMQYGRGSSTLKQWIENCLLLDDEMIKIKQSYVNEELQLSNINWKIPFPMSVETVCSMFKFHYVPDIIKNVEMIEQNTPFTSDYVETRIRLIYNEETNNVTNGFVNVG